MSGHRKSRGNPWFKVSIVLIPVAAISTGSLFAWFLFRTLFADRHTESAQSQPAENLQGIESLVRRGNAAIPELTAMLSSADPKTRRQALFGLSRLGPKAAEALPAVGDRLSDDDAKVRAMAFAAFEQICTDKEQVVIVAAKLLGDADAAVRESAAKTLESIPSFLPAANAIAKAVAEMVGHRQPATRIRAAQILHGRTSGDDAATNQLLRGLLSDPDLDVRTSAAGIVADRGGGSGDEIRVWLRDSNAGLVNKALGAVRCLCPDAVQTLPEIQALLDKAEGVQLDWVLSALRSLGDTAKPAAERLLQRVATMEPRRQLLASDVLLQIGAEPGAVTSLLATLVRSGDDDMARYAGQLLARASPDEARRQVAFIVAQIGDDRQWVAREDRRRLLEFTGNTGSQAGVNGSALHALSGMGPAAEEAVPLLIRLLASDEEWAQRDAAEALGGIGPPAASAVPALLAQIASLKPDSRH
ncbi:MAG TPA: HEAT repeat domain-containing protein, partial [Planctomycetaceae bacterium]|nr:HEAT repeat domain-containing protein [Planctomycetaceae bacterium]